MIEFRRRANAPLPLLVWSAILFELAGDRVDYARRAARDRRGVPENFFSTVYSGLFWTYSICRRFATGLFLFLMLPR